MGATATTLVTARSFFPSSDPALGPISRFFDGEATSEVGLDAGWRRDVWTAVAPDVERLRTRIEEGDKVFAGAELTPEQRGAFMAQALTGLTRSYVKDAPPATFRLIESPLVTALWIGATLALAGGLISLMPTRERSRVTAPYAARVGAETRAAETAPA